MRYLSHNNLLRWFLEPRDQLPAAYRKKCEKFFNELQAASDKPQASSVKLDKQTNEG